MATWRCGLMAQEADTCCFCTGSVAWMRVAVDMRAHGCTPATGPVDSLTFEAFADDVADVIEAVGARAGRPPIAVAGVSMGAEVALHLVAKRPLAAAALILVRPAWAGGQVQNPMLPLYELVRSYLRAEGPSGVARFVQTPEYQEILRRSPQAAQSLRRQFERLSAAERADVLTAIPRSPQLPLEQVRRIRLPTLVLAAPHEPGHPVSAAETLAAALGGPVQFTMLPQKLPERGEHERRLLAATGAFLMSLDPFGRRA